MLTAAISTARRVLSPAWLAGPILGKELRVSSRRRRNYMLRVGYLFVLTIFVAGAWLAGTRDGGSGGGYQISRMSQVGKQIVLTVTWVQFIAAQLLAVEMLSGSISEEIRRGTLSALLSTPISSVQIVTGKLLSKMLQILVLLAAGLPVLAAVRVFGGVPWVYVLGGVCVTVTASMFAGALSLAFSIKTHRSFTVTVRVLLILVGLYAVLPALTGLMLFAGLGGNLGIASWIMLALGLTNPSSALASMTARVLMPGQGLGAWEFLYPLMHCLVMLGLTAGVLALAARSIRRSGLRQVMGQGPAAEKGGRVEAGPVGGASRTARPGGPIRRVSDRPVFWREIHSVRPGRGRWRTRIAAGIAVGLVLLTYAATGWVGMLGDDYTQTVYCVIFMLFALTASLSTCAAGIPAEKESRTWPILLTTPLSDGEIASGKMLGAMRRCLPAWMPLFGHLTLFTLVGVLYPTAIVHMAMLSLGTLVFLAGLGVYVGSMTRRTNAASGGCLAAVLAVWLILPTLLGWVSIAPRPDGPAGVLATLNPVLQAVVVVSGAAEDSLHYSWPDGSAQGFLPTTWRVLASSLLHAGLGVALAWRGTFRFRRKLFQT